MATESATHVVASLYAFSDAAKHEVVENFSQSEAGRNADLQHTPENLFIIRCAKNDPTPFLKFLEYMNKFIASEREKVPELFESVKLKRLADTQTDTTVDLADASLGIQKEQLPSVANEEDAVEKALIPHEIFTRSWRSSLVKELSDTGLRFPESLLKVIGGLNNCRVELETDGATITARAENMQDVEKAIAKVKSIDDWAYLRSTFPLSYDFCYVEGELDIMLQMVPLKEFPDRRLQTTLTPSNLPPVKNLSNHLAVAMLKKGAIISTVQNGRPLSHSNLKECQLWKSHLFGSYGDENVPTAQGLGGGIPSPDRLTSPAQSLGRPDGRTVDQWIKQSAATGFADPFSPSTVPQVPPSPIRKPSPEPEIQPPPVRKRHIRVRKPLGVETSSTDIADPIVPHQETVVHPAPSDPNIPNGVAADTSSSDVNLSSTKDDSTQSTGIKSLEANHHAIADDVLLHDKSTSGPLEEIQNHVNGVPDLIDSHENTSTEDEQVAINNAVLFPPPIKAPYMPAEPKPSSNPDDSVSEPTWTDQVVVGIPGGSLIDLSPSRGSLQERVQRESEVDTRSVKRTMNQKKPALLAGSSNSLATFYKNFELASTEILKLAQKAQGPLTLQMEIGRILIGPQSSSSEVKKKPFAVSDWSLVFPGGRKVETPFTKVLTTVPNDAEFILDLKLSVKRKMFVNGAVKQRVTYNFDCRTRTNDQVIVEIEENGTFKAGFFLTATGLSWDARMVVNCFEHVSNEIQEAAQDLVDNLRIIPAADRKTFEFSVKSSAGSLQILSGFLRREASHRSSDCPDILVHLCEVQDLGLWQPNGPKGPYEGALLSPQSAAINAGKLWWEVTVSCVEVGTRLQANDHLEVGSSGNWRPADILAADSMSHLCTVTRDIVTRIDSVGCYNKGPKGGSGTKTSDRDKKAEVVYW